jgi:hypothetical protein
MSEKKFMSFPLHYSSESQSNESLQTLQNSIVHRKTPSSVNSNRFFCSVLGTCVIRKTASIHSPLHSNPEQLTSLFFF